VSTYSALFNYRSKFAAPQTLVLDDAHAADDYVAGHWTVTVDRDKMPATYRKLVSLIDPIVDRRTAGLLMDTDPLPIERTSVELVPLPRWWPFVDALRDLLESEVQDTDQFYAWDHHVRAGLAACNLLVSWQEIVLRPLVPATAKQAGFHEAHQRIYMSATLGAGGELERIFGVRSIERLPVPEEWQRHSTGRRLFQHGPHGRGHGRRTRREARRPSARAHAVARQRQRTQTTVGGCGHPHAWSE
jgi:hypothetical protein